MASGVGLAMVAVDELASLPSFLPLPLLALVIGIILGRLGLSGVQDGARLAASHLLHVGIVLLGFQLSFGQVAEVGAGAAGLIVLCVASGGIGCFWLAQKMRLSVRMSLLLATGTAVCGNSAIVAIAPGIGAEDDEVATSIAAITLYGTVAVFVFPLIGGMLEMSTVAFATWAGTAINDTSQVVAAGFSVSDSAGEAATIVKLTRNLAIVPAALITPMFIRRSQPGAVRLTRAIPWFVVGFLVTIAFGNLIDFPASVLHVIALASKIAILAALTGIGMRVASLTFDRKVLVPLIVGSSAGIMLALVSLAFVRSGLWIVALGLDLS